MKIIIGIFVGSIVVIIDALFGAWLNRNSAKKTASNTAWQDYRTLHSFIMPQEDEDYNDVELKKTTQFHIDHLLQFTEYAKHRRKTRKGKILLYKL